MRGRFVDAWTISWTIRKKIGTYATKTPPSLYQKPPIPGRDFIYPAIGLLKRRQHAEDMQYIRGYGRVWADGLAVHPLAIVIVACCMPDHTVLHTFATTYNTARDILEPPLL